MIETTTTKGDTMRIISGQRYRDQDRVDQKIAAEDFVVTITPEFEFEGDVYSIVINGHHAHEAAIQSGQEPIFEISDDIEIEAIVKNVDDALEMYQIDSDYYDITTGNLIW